jgi:hypothetical protein
MNRRAVLVAAAALALVLTPSVAMAYTSPGYKCTVSDTTPAIGQPVTLHMVGAEANEKVSMTITTNPASISNSSIQIAGTKSMTKPASAAGVADFRVTLASAGVYSLGMTDASGAVLANMTLTVAGAGTGTRTPTAARLGFTGFNGMGLAVGGGVLVLVGAGAVVASKRRRSVKVPA